MRRSFLVPLLVVLFSLTVISFHHSLRASVASAAPNNVVRVDGGLISGTSSPEGIRIYKGIPYAGTTEGEFRWKPPQPVKPWEGTRKCEEYGPDCPQAPYATTSLFYSQPRPQSEDCLFLNVWTGAPAAERRPVMVWIHGGALTRGSGSTRTYDGTELARKGVVLVTVNYRLGPLGYLAHSELSAESPNHSSGNYGVLDQIAALKWVKKNIAAFGGDPSRVTIFGESAGSWSVNVLVASPLARGLFQRAIGESGGTFGANTYLKEDRPTRPSAEKVGEAFAKTAGAQSIKDLRAVPADKIIDIFNNNAEGRRFRSQPNVDGWVLPDEVRGIFAKSRQNDVPVIVGSNANEMTSLTTQAQLPKTIDDYRKRMDAQFRESAKELDTFYPVKSDADVQGAYLAILRDTTFSLQMRTWARMTATGKSKAWLYSFTHAPPNANSKYLGAYHAGEIAYVFNNITKTNAAHQPVDASLANQISNYWVNFAKTGDPNGAGLVKWTAYDKDSEPYLDLGDPITLRNHLLKQQLDFIEKTQAQRQ